MMRVIIIGIALQVLALGCCVVAISLPGTSSIRKRQANTGFYTPTTTACPSGGLVRDTITTISQEEADYIQKHLEATQSNWTSWLSSSNGPNLDADGGISGGVKAYTSNVKNLPRVAISLSGGGLRAMVRVVIYIFYRPFSIFLAIHDLKQNYFFPIFPFSSPVLAIFKGLILGMILQLLEVREDSYNWLAM